MPTCSPKSDVSSILSLFCLLMEIKLLLSSYSCANKSDTVDLPNPEPPTSAIFSPALISNEKFGLSTVHLHSLDI